MSATGFRVLFRPPSPRTALGCWLALPDRPDPGAPPLVAVHGVRRAADEQALLLGPQASLTGRPVIAPCFDQWRWPRFQRIGSRSRADQGLIALLDELEREGIGSARRFDLFGFSAGAQFAHRFAMLHPERLHRLTVASAGWYTFPDDRPYPLGLGPKPRGNDALAAAMRARLGQFLRLPIDIGVGTRDDRRDRNTRRGAHIDRQQGQHRLERAQRWSQALVHASTRLGMPSRIRLTLLPGVGHDFHRCILRGGLDRLVVGPHLGDGPALSVWPRVADIRSLAAPCPAGRTMPMPRPTPTTAAIAVTSG